MTWKDFLQPELNKVILWIIFILMCMFYTFSVFSPANLSGIGILSSVHVDTSLCPENTTPKTCPPEFMSFGIYIGIVDIILYYLIASLIIWGYRRYKR